jgi:hypothetical protein
MHPSLLVISNKRYTTDFRKYLMRSAQRHGARAMHIYSWEKVIVSYEDKEQHTFNPDQPAADLLDLVHKELGNGQILALTGLGGYIHTLPFALATSLKNAIFVYDVYDDFSYGASGLSRLRKLCDDIRWRRITDQSIVLSRGLKRFYPFAKHVDNASHCTTRCGREQTNKFVYVGSIDHRVDFSWLRSLARGVDRLDIYGRIHAGDQDVERKLNEFLGEYPAAHYFGEYDNDELDEILSKYSVGLVPYKPVDRTTTYVNPDKLYHYLNCGLEVLSSPFPQAQLLKQFLHLVDADDDWHSVLAGLAKSRAQHWPRENYSWDVRWGELRQSLDF